MLRKQQYYFYLYEKIIIYNLTIVNYGKIQSTKNDEITNLKLLYEEQIKFKY